MDKILNFINNEFVGPVSDKYLDNYNPANGKVYSHVPDSDERDVNNAVKAAESAFSLWTDTPALERSKVLLKISELIEKNLEQLAQAESIDNGKPLTLARSLDIPRASSNFRFFATAIMHFFSEAHIMEETALNYTIRTPLGVVGCISPWNLPLYLFTWKVAPAIASGNTVVAKPSEITPMTAYLLCKICKEAGLPAGVFNIVHGLGNKVGTAITSHIKIEAISFTGGTVTGAEIARIAGPLFKKLLLELGGKNPTIIFSDCNYEEMLNTTIKSSFSNQGEICLCGSRIFIERDIYNKFRQDFVRKTELLVVGDPKDEKSNLGAIVSKQHFDKILSYIKLAKEEGGKILTGGSEVKLSGELETGWYIRPTVIESLSPYCRTNQEEIFGPVVSLMPFDSEEEVLMYANSTKYGLASIIWTENLTRAHRMANKIQTGIIWINCWMLRDLRTPFGGVKHSGFGAREGGFEVLRFFTEPKNVAIKLKN